MKKLFYMCLKLFNHKYCGKEKKLKLITPQSICVIYDDYQKYHSSYTSALNLIEIEKRAYISDFSVRIIAAIYYENISNKHLSKKTVPFQKSFSSFMNCFFGDGNVNLMLLLILR
jgi:hypothetical protein